MGLFVAIQIYAGNVPLNFTTLDMKDPNAKKVMELVEQNNIVETMKVFYKINNNLYLFDNCNASRRFSGINLINVSKGTNKQIALSKCSLASSDLIMFNIDPFSKEFRLLTTYHEDTYFRVTESKCDFQGNCNDNNLLTYRIPEPKANLCNEKENSVFSCTTGEKIISICEERHVSSENNILTYRFGKPKTKPELEYSSKPGEMDKYFNFASEYYANGSIKEISFKIGKYNYTVHQDRHNYRENSAGLVLEKDNKKIAYFKCNNLTPDSSWDIDYKLKVHQARHIGTKAP